MGNNRVSIYKPEQTRQLYSENLPKMRWPVYLVYLFVLVSSEIKDAVSSIGSIASSTAYIATRLIDVSVAQFSHIYIYILTSLWSLGMSTTC